MISLKSTMAQKKKRSMFFKSAIVLIGVVAVTWTGFVGASSSSQNSIEVNNSIDVVPTGRVGINIGDEAPNIIMNNPKGKEMKLSD